jgi:hypothetical protein
MDLSFDHVFKTLAANKAARDYPGRQSARCVDGYLWPALQPTFTIEPGTSIFTIGSCFARNIEEALMPLGFELPTRRMVTPLEERGPRRPNGILNEFNPGTMQQRILCALSGRALSDDTLVPSANGLTADLLLFGGHDVTYERAVAIRGEVAAVYSRLAVSQYAIITLGLVEAWYDNQTNLFLNRMPPVAFMKANPNRYSMRRLEAQECYELLEPAIAGLVDRGVKILLTVSPVPLNATMISADAVVANGASKASLRVTADRLCRQFKHVDYFPSYEIVQSGGLDSFLDDNLHVKDELVHRVTRYMVHAYCPSQETATAA